MIVISVVTTDLFNAEEMSGVVSPQYVTRSKSFAIEMDFSIQLKLLFQFRASEVLIIDNKCS